MLQLTDSKITDNTAFNITMCRLIKKNDFCQPSIRGKPSSFPQTRYWPTLSSSLADELFSETNEAMHNLKQVLYVTLPITSDNDWAFVAFSVSSAHLSVFIAFISSLTCFTRSLIYNIHSTTKQLYFIIINKWQTARAKSFRLHLFVPLAR